MIDRRIIDAVDEKRKEKQNRMRTERGRGRRGPYARARATKGSKEAKFEILGEIIQNSEFFPISESKAEPNTRTEPNTARNPAAALVHPPPPLKGSIGVYRRIAEIIISSTPPPPPLEEASGCKGVLPELSILGSWAEVFKL